MYVMQISLYRAASHLLLGNALYERIREPYKLPSLATLQQSLTEEVEWPPDIEAYYLDNLREANSKHLFQLRFLTSLRGQHKTSLFFSMEEHRCLNLTFVFPARGNIMCASQIIGALKEISRELLINEIPLVVEGFMEMGAVRFIREVRLSGFVWIEGLQRYLHVSEDPSRAR